MFKIEIFFVCDVYRTFVPIKFPYISSYKHYEMAFPLVPHSCQNLHFKSCFLILWKRRSTADGYFNNIESALLHPNNSVWAQNDPFCFPTWLFNASLIIWSSKIQFESVIKQNTLHILIFCIDGRDVFLVVDQILVSFSPYCDGDTYQMEMHTRSFIILNLQP